MLDESGTYFVPDSVIYHGGCYDGFTAAWLLRRAFGDELEFLPAKYGEPIPGASGTQVLMVDFSGPRAEMERLDSDLHRFLILDHHKTAEENLRGLPFAVFDMERSGCQMVWDWLQGHPDYRPDAEPYKVINGRHWLVEHVADRDLWRLALPNTPKVHAYYSSVPMAFDEWDTLARAPLDDVVAGGSAIRRSIDRYCERVGADAIGAQTPWGGVLLVNAPYLNASELASWLIEQGPRPWAVAWFQRADGKFQYSLRGRGFDVSVVAREYGGGGHVGAAGFESAHPPWELWPQ